MFQDPWLDLGILVAISGMQWPGEHLHQVLLDNEPVCNSHLYFIHEFVVAVAIFRKVALFYWYMLWKAQQLTGCSTLKQILDMVFSLNSQYKSLSREYHIVVSSTDYFKVEYIRAEQPRMLKKIICCSTFSALCSRISDLRGSRTH